MVERAENGEGEAVVEEQFARANRQPYFRLVLTSSTRTMASANDTPWRCRFDAALAGSDS